MLDLDLKRRIISLKTYFHILNDEIKKKHNNKKPNQIKTKTATCVRSCGT